MSSRRDTSEHDRCIDDDDEFFTQRAVSFELYHFRIAMNGV
jgi:hypothetical protein